MPDTPMPGGPTMVADLTDLPHAAQFVLRGGPEAARAAGAALGLDLPEAACRAERRGDRAALWQGPDEWLLLTPADQEAAIEASLQAALATTPHALVGVGHRNVTLQLAGPRAADMLRAGCPLDLDPRAFPVGMCTRTVLAKAPVTLWRTAPLVFCVIVWRSFRPYVRDFLIEARTRLGPT